METKMTVKAGLNLGTLMKNYAAYNHWANTQLVNWLKSKSYDLMDKKIPSSFPSLKSTLIHIWDTQRFWLSVLQQTTAPISFRQGFEGTVDDVFYGLEEHSEEFSTYVNSLSESEITEEVSLDTPWVKGARSRFEFIQHVMNHSTYHRGQLVTIGHTLGLMDAPMTDYNFYVMLVKS